MKSLLATSKLHARPDDSGCLPWESVNRSMNLINSMWMTSSFTYSWEKSANIIDTATTCILSALPGQNYYQIKPLWISFNIPKNGELRICNCNTLCHISDVVKALSKQKSCCSASKITECLGRPLVLWSIVEAINSAQGSYIIGASMSETLSIHLNVNFVGLSVCHGLTAYHKSLPALILCILH